MDYKHTYNGKRLLEKYTLDHSGVWRIYGEDPNCDFGGHHHEPFLGAVEGRLEDAIAYAETLPNFWTWGGGGRIELQKKETVKKLAPGYGKEQNKIEREKKRKALEQKLKEIQKELEELE